MSTPADGSIIIDCDECVMRGTDTCRTCVVTFICDRDPSSAVVIDPGESEALRLLGRSGLVPLLCHRRVAS
jgi:hypothetical protein